MPLFADLFQTALLIVCLVGLGLAARRALPEVSFPLLFCFAPVALAACLFLLEHFVPLGQQPWLWIPGTLTSVWLMHKAGRDLALETVLWYFLLGFGYCFLWRYSYPDIQPFSDRMNDHVQLMNYSAGGQLPAEDIWMKGAKSNTYYIFQYYMAGLIHRFIGCGPGLTFHLGYCAIIGLTTAAVGSALQFATQSIKAGLFACLFILLGGSGTTLVTPFMEYPAAPSPLAAERFVGSYAMPSVPEFKTDFAVKLIHFIGQSDVDAPMSYFSYAIYIGDYHPTLSCFFFLALGILAITAAERAPPGGVMDKFCVIAAVSTPFFMLISNTWTAPLQDVLVIGWLVYRRTTGRNDSLHFLFITGVVWMASIFPYFGQFAHESSGYSAHFQLVPDRPPFLNWLLIMLPGWLAWACCFWVGLTSPLARLFLVVGLIVIDVTYFFEMHGDYGGVFEVYDSTMKWWPWVYFFLTVMGLACVWRCRVLRLVIVAVFTLTIVANSYIMGAYWWYIAQDHRGRLDGYAWFTDDKNQNAIYQQLQTLPRGIVLESAPDNSDAAAITLAQFTGHYSLGGWPWFEDFWRGYREDIDRLGENRDKFYLGKLENPRSWLRGIIPGGVTYIVWLDRDNKRGPALWAQINNQIKDDYDWRSTDENGDSHWGIWISRNAGQLSSN